MARRPVVRLELPGAGRHLVAAVVDAVGITAMLALCLWFVVRIGGVRPSPQGVIDALHASPLDVVPLAASLPVAFFVWHLLALAFSGTPGQRVAGLVLVDAAGRRPSRARLVVRAAGQALGGVLFLAGPAWALLVDARRRGLGEILTGTCAVIPPKDRGEP
jgi:hypothetical protein